jgi:hypothetical protein
MNRFQNYAKAKRLSANTNSNISTAALKFEWRTNRSNAYWKGRVRGMTTQIVRRRNTRRSTIISAELGQVAEARSKQQRINRKIRNNNFQAVINGVLNGDTLNPLQIEKLWNRITAAGRYVLTVNFDNNTVKNITFNITSRDFINDILKNGLVLREIPRYGSDLINEFDFDNITSLTISKIVTPRRVIANADGAFFPHINISKVDLKPYQIFTQNDAYNKNEMKNREQCLIATLTALGIKKALVNQIKISHVSGASISKKDLHKIANIIKKNINISTWSGRLYQQKIKATPATDDEIKINLYENHYFPQELTKYSPYSILHYEEVKDLPEWWNIVKIRKGKGRKIAYVRSKKLKISSLQLVQKLHKAGYFQKLDMTKFEESSSHIDLREHIYLDNIINEQQKVPLVFSQTASQQKEHQFADIRRMQSEQYTEPTVSPPRADSLESSLRGDSLERESNGIPTKEEIDEDHKLFMEEMGWDEPDVKYQPKIEKIIDEIHNTTISTFNYNLSRQEEAKELFKEEDEEEDEEKDKKAIYYSDCETFTGGTNHELYMLGVVGSDSDMVDIWNVCDQPVNENVSAEQQLVYKLLNLVTKNKTQNALVYFHNLKYDNSIIEKYLSVMKRCEKDGQLYNVVCKYGGFEVEFRDSYKIIPFALKKFGKEFDLPKDIRKKEAISYGYYTKDNNNKIIKTREYRDLLNSSDKHIFSEIVKDEDSYNLEDKTFNPLEYYKKYLKLDCLVLKKGIEKFSTLISEITENKMSLHDCLTISSLTDKYMKVEGAYEGIYEMGGNLRAYVAKAVYGGRVCVNSKYKKKVIHGKISDYDGVSLYPSAIYRLCRLFGLPTGRAKRFSQSNLVNWEDMIYSVMTVKITKVNKKQQMPFIAHKSKDSIQYSNDPPVFPDGTFKPIVIDKYTLQDYIKFHEIEYEILDGVYWNEGTNKTMGEVIKRLFDARLKCKAEGNKALSNTIKLMLNSSYGKTIMKKAKSMKKIVNISGKVYNKTTNQWTSKEKTKWDNFVYRNFNTIKSWRKLNDISYEVEMICADDSFNRGHIGCAILSMSKRIMNEVFDVANDNNYPIYYTDTDSLHCNYADVLKLETKYEEKYNRVLNGKNLEQFHTDFDLDGACDEIYATKSIFLGKKSYIDCLESKDKDGNIITGHHIRLKGITEAGLEHTAKTYSTDGKTPEYFKMYEDLANGTPKKIILNPYNKETNSQKVLFEFSDGNVGTRKEFIREVKF